jgi:hypothetical protein
VSNLSIEDRKRLIAAASARGFTGIGIYENSLHFDMRAGGPAMWGPSHHADSIPAWASGAQEAHAANAGKPGGGRDYHVPGATPDGFQTIEVQPIQGMQVNDFVKLLRTRGLEVAGIQAPEVQVGEEPVWTMAVKLPNQMVGSREGGTKVPALPDGGKDLPAMEAAIKAAGLEPDQEQTALQTVRTKYELDQKQAEQAYKETYNQATATAMSELGGWRKIDAATWSKLKPEDQAKLSAPPKYSDLDTKIEFLKNPALALKGSIEKYADRLSIEDYNKFYTEANGPKANIPEATFDSDMFNVTLIKNGMQGLIQPGPNDVKFKEQQVSLRNEFKVRIDAEQTRTGKTLSRDEKQKILDGIFIDKAFTDDSTFMQDSNKPLIFMSDDEMTDAYVQIGDEQIYISKGVEMSSPSAISKQQIANFQEILRQKGEQATMQAIVEEWVRAGKPK